MLQEADPELQEALMNSKMDMFASEYNHLLVTQLDSQRKYFEGLLQKVEDDRLAETAIRQSDLRAVEELRHLTNTKTNLEARVVSATKNVFLYLSSMQSSRCIRQS